MGRYSGKTCRMSTMFILTAAFFLLEVIYGYMTRSMALIADSFHMLSDVLALIIAFACMKISKRTKTKKNTYGWVRAEVLGALVNTVFLIALSFSIILEAIQRLFEYEYIRDPENVLIVGVAGLVVNIIGLFLFHGHGSGHGHGHSHGHGRHLTEISAEEDSNPSETSDQSCQKLKSVTSKSSNGQQMNMYGIWLHILGDTLGSVIVVVNAIVNWQTDVEFLKRYLDPLMSLLLSFIIIGTSIPLLKESAMILLQTVPSHIDVKEIEGKLLSRFSHKIIAVHDFHIWRLSGNKIVASLHVTCRGGLDSYMSLAEKLKEFFHDEGIHSTTVQVELVEDSHHHPFNHCILMCPKDASNGERTCTAHLCCKPPETPIFKVISPESFVNPGKYSLYPFSDSSARSSYRRACDNADVTYI